jgi:FkbM family methyltransferase
MSVETDFNYLKSQTSRKEDRAKLDAIAKDRQRILFENLVIKDKRYTDIHLGKLVFFFRKDLAPGSIDTYIEIFRDHVHTKIPEFQPKNCSSVIDIGANEGFYTLYMKSRNPGLRIISVEPVPDTFQILTRNIKANGFDDIQTVQAAVREKNGSGKIEIYPHVSSISSIDIMNQSRPWVRPEWIQVIPVKTITVPSLFRQFELIEADILKIDAENSEWNILSSSESVLGQVRKIVLEWHSAELREKCIRFLKARNFTLVHEERRRIGDSYFLNRNYA